MELDAREGVKFVQSEVDMTMQKGCCRTGSLRRSDKVKTISKWVLRPSLVLFSELR